MRWRSLETWLCSRRQRAGTAGVACVSQGVDPVAWASLSAVAVVGNRALLPEATGRLESFGIAGMRTASPNNQMQRMGRGFGVSSIGEGGRIAETPHR